jgi:hypothetical protein
MEFLYVVAFSTGLILLARSLRPAIALRKLLMQASRDYKIKTYAAWQASRRAERQPARSTSERLRMHRFSKSRPTELEAVAELIWFAELKYERGEFIWFDDLPTIRNSQGVECVCAGSHYALSRSIG